MDPKRHGLSHGKAKSKMDDDWAIPHSHVLGNLHSSAFGATAKVPWVPWFSSQISWLSEIETLPKSVNYQNRRTP